MSMLYEFPAVRIISELSRNNLLPAILFRSARKQCDEDVQKLSTARLAQMAHREQDALIDEVDAIIAKYQVDPAIVKNHPQFGALITTGVGAHHAGQLLFWRLMLEELMTRSMLRMMIATGTVAAGVDFPARTVIITAHSKRGNDGFATLTSAEFQQMSGRAGRRGKDAIGICLVAPSRFLDARVIHDVCHRPPEPLRSAYFAAPSTMLNLLKYRNVDDLTFTVQRSLASFLDRKSAQGIREDAARDQAQLDMGDVRGAEQRRHHEKRVRRKLRQADELVARQEETLKRAIAGLTNLGHMSGGSLTEKGTWAAELYTSLVLELAEAISSDIFTDLSAHELAGLIGSIAGDSHRTYLSLRQCPVAKEHLEAMREIVQRVREGYQNPQTNDLAVVPDAATTVITWMDAQSWDEFSGLLRLAGAAEGDVARLITQTADHLNQISRLHRSHPALARTADKAREMLLRPPISQSALSESAA